MKAHLRKYWWSYLICVSITLFVAVDLSRKALSNPRAKFIPLTREQQFALEQVEQRLELCQAFASSQGNPPSASSALTNVRTDIRSFHESGEDRFLRWADSDIRVAYRAARKPAEVAELYQRFEEARAAYESGPKIAPSCYDHLDAARKLIEQYASGWNEAIPQMVRDELQYVKDVSQIRKPPATTELTELVDALHGIREQLGASPESYRLQAHGKQAQRFFDSWLAANASSAKLFELAQSEVYYVRKITADSKFVAAAPEKDNDPARLLLLVDRFAANLERRDREFANDSDIGEKLASVRAGFDFMVKQLVERRTVIAETWYIRQALEDCESAMQKAKQQKGGSKFID